MKFIISIILLFLFSNHSFAYLEGRALICKGKGAKEIKYKYYSFEFIKDAKALNSKLIKEGDKYQWDYRYTYEVYTDSDFITLKVGDYKLKLDRKTLILTPPNFPSHKAICEVYPIEEAYEKQLQILKQEQDIFDKEVKGIRT
jgi:hypothetical protein